MEMMGQGGLMGAIGPQTQQEAPQEVSSEEREVDSDLVFESAKAFLATPEGTQNLMQAIQGAKDVGVAIGKIAAMVVKRITDELDNAQMGVNEDSVFGEDGGLVKVLVVIYTIANANGANLVMEESLAQAFEVAESDLEKAYAQLS